MIHKRNLTTWLLNEGKTIMNRLDAVSLAIVKYLFIHALLILRQKL